MNVRCVKVGLAILFLLLPSLVVFPVHAQQFPRDRLTMIVTFSPGGGYDVQARGLARFLEKYLPGDYRVLVENRPGGGGTLGTNYAWSAPPDGHTILQSGVLGQVIVQTLRPAEVRFKMSEFRWLGAYDVDTRAWGVRPDLNFANWDELMAYARSQPLLMGTAGAGDATHFEPAVAAQSLGLPVEFVHYPGSADMVAGLARGEIDMASLGVTSMARYVEQGVVKFLFVFSDRRSPFAPDVPTVLEFGVSREAYEAVPPVVGGPRALAVPPGTPDYALATLRSAFAAVMEDPDYDAWRLSVPMDKNFIPGDDFQDYVARMESSIAEIAPLLSELLGY